MRSCFLSGLSSIAYELVWQRLLVRTAGATLPAVSTIFCIFIGGLWLGSLLSIPIGRSARSPLRMYALIELGIAAFGIGIPVLFSDRCAEKVLALEVFPLAMLIPAGMVEVGAAIVQNCLSLLALFLPAVLMGLTFNLVIAFTNSRIEKSKTERCLFTFYASNILGGALGCLLTSFFLVPSVGLSITSMLMALVNLLAFFLLFACSLVVFPYPEPLEDLLALLLPARGETAALSPVTTSFSPGSEGQATALFKSALPLKPKAGLQLVRELLPVGHSSLPMTTRQAPLTCFWEFPGDNGFGSELDSPDDVVARVINLFFELCSAREFSGFCRCCLLYCCFKKRFFEHIQYKCEWRC